MNCPHISGVDLTQIDGIDVGVGQTFLREVGLARRRSVKSLHATVFVPVADLCRIRRMVAPSLSPLSVRATKRETLIHEVTLLPRHIHSRSDRSVMHVSGESQLAN